LSLILSLHTRSLFFASTTGFLEAFDAKNDPAEVTVRFQHSGVADFSGLEALNTLMHRYQRQGKTVLIEQLTDDLSLKLLRKAGNLLTADVKAQFERVEVDQSVTRFGQLERGKDTKQD